MSKYEVVFDLEFNGKKAKTYKFKVNGHDKNEAFDNAEDMIKSRMKHKIKSINEVGSPKEGIDYNKMDELSGVMSDPDNATVEDMEEAIEFLDDLTDMIKIAKRMKKRGY